MNKILIFIACFIMTVSVSASESWVATWATAPEAAAKADMPQKTTLSNSSIRQTVHVSIGGKTMRVKLSNQHSSKPLEIKSVYIANPADGTDIDSSSAKYLEFCGSKSVAINPGQIVWSDSINYELKPLQYLSLTINYGASVPKIACTTHRGSRTTSYIMEGRESKPTENFKVDEQLEHWYSISAIDVEGSGLPCVAVIGNSITDGRGSTDNLHNRWTDFMAEALEGRVGVINLGIGGNCVVTGGIGIPMSERFENDVLSQSGLTAVIIAGGINDIGGSKHSEKTSRQLIRAFTKFITECKARGVKVYGATITPIGGTSHWSMFHEAARQTVNDWILNSGEFDGVIDFDKAIADPKEPTNMYFEYSYDALHPNPKGYSVMGKLAADIVRK